MSLKAFHIVFITASILLAFGFGGWCLKGYADWGGAARLGFGVASVLTGVGLTIYGRYFLRKTRHIGYL